MAFHNFGVKFVLGWNYSVTCCGYIKQSDSSAGLNTDPQVDNQFANTWEAWAYLHTCIPTYNSCLPAWIVCSGHLIWDNKL